MKKSDQNRKWDAEAFNRESNPQLISAMKLMQQHKKFPLSHLKICDVGCGGGKTTKWLSIYYPDSIVHGIDNSPDMIATAKNQFPIHEHQYLSFQKMDAKKNYYKQSFNIVTSFFVLQWVDKPKIALQKMVDSLIPGGKAYFIIPLRHEEMWSAIEETSRDPAWQQYFNHYINPRKFFTHDEYRNMVKSTGLEIDNWQYQEQNGAYSHDKLKGFIASWLPHLEKLDKTLHPLFLDAILAKIKTKVDIVNNEMQVPFRWLEIECSRPKLIQSLVASETSLLYWNCPPAQGTRSLVKARGLTESLMDPFTKSS